jgi:hypothetical protein
MGSYTDRHPEKEQRPGSAGPRLAAAPGYEDTLFFYVIENKTEFDTINELEYTYSTISSR